MNQLKGITPMSNQLMAISPYWCDDTGMWVFDDDAYSLVKEPFVCGIPEMIEEATSHIKDAKNGFRLLFSSASFPGHNMILNRLREEDAGWWYENGQGLSGWLCPALFNYFSEAPERIYVQVSER